MNQLEVSTMALTLERDHQFRPARLERLRRIHEHLSASPSTQTGALKLAWHEAGGVLRARWQCFTQPKDESAPHGATAAASAT